MDNTHAIKAGGSLEQVESIAECSTSICLENIFRDFFWVVALDRFVYILICDAL